MSLNSQLSFGVSSALITEGSIVNADISASAAIANSKIAGLAASATTDTTNAANIGSGTLPAARLPAFTGDITTTAGAVGTTLATVNSNVGAFGSASAVPVITVNAKGLITAVSTTAVTIPSGSISVTGGDITLSGNTGTAITNATLATVNSNVGTFNNVTVNAKGLVTAASNVSYLSAATASTTYLALAGGTLTGAVTFDGTTNASAGPIITSSSTAGPRLSIRSTDTGGKDIWLISNGTANGDGAGKLQLYNATDAYTAATFATTSSMVHRLYGSYTQMSGSARAPIFYDSDDTAYYTDPNSRSVLSTLNVGSATTIGTGKLSVFAGGASAVGWGTGFNIGDASNYTTWIQDAGVSRFRNTGTGGMDWYNSGAATKLLALSDAGTFIIPAGDIRSPIFYDYNDTAYYLNPASTSNINQLNMNGPIVRTVSGQGYLNGNYPSSETVTSSGAIYSIGGAYVPGTTTLGNMYGVGYAYSGSGRAVGTNPAGAPVDNWGLYGASNGVLSWFLSSSVGSGYFTGTVNAPIFYDKDNTGYYLDPNSTTSLRTVGDWRSDSSTWSGEFSGKMQYHSNHWYIQGADLFIYRNAPGSNVFTINQSGQAVATGDMRAPIFYDYNDTGYYIDPNSASDSALRMRGGALFGPNTTWSQYLYVGTNGNIDVNTASIAATNGNLHIDAKNGYVLYLNNYATSSYTMLNQSARSPIFYDSNDTAYYCDPNGTSELTAFSNGTKARAGLNIHHTNRQANTTDTNYWVGTQGWNESHTWNSALTTLGSGFMEFWGSNRQHPQGNNYTHAQGLQILHYRDGGGGDTNISYGWQMVGAADAANRWWLRGKWGSTIRSWYEIVTYGINVGGTLYPSISYDSDNTGYYVDANSTSRMGTINADVLYSYGNVTAYSDERLKKDWETLPTNFVEELAKIKSGTYTRIDSGERQVGVGAQSLQAILKEAVSEKEEYLGVHYGNTAMVSAVELAKVVMSLKQAIKEQQTQIEEQNKRIAFLEAR